MTFDKEYDNMPRRLPTTEDVRLGIKMIDKQIAQLILRPRWWQVRTRLRIWWTTRKLSKLQTSGTDTQEGLDTWMWEIKNNDLS